MIAAIPPRIKRDPRSVFLMQGEVAEPISHGECGGSVMRGRTLTWQRGLIVGLLLGTVGPASCLDDKEGNGWKGLNHELTIFAVVHDYGTTTGGTEVAIIGFNLRQDGPITPSPSSGSPLETPQKFGGET